MFKLMIGSRCVKLFCLALSGLLCVPFLLFWPCRRGATFTFAVTSLTTTSSTTLAVNSIFFLRLFGLLAENPQQNIIGVDVMGDNNINVA